MRKIELDSAGLTLLELLVVIAVVGIVAGLAVPAMSNFFDSKRLIGAAEQTYSHLQQARLESIARSAPAFANFSADGSQTWTYGVSHRNLCDVGQAAATGANACVLVVNDGDGIVDPGDGSADTGDLVLMRFPSTQHAGVSMSIAGFSSGNTQIRFDPVRGTATSGDISLVSPAGKRLNVRVGLLGQIRICTPDDSVPGYSTGSC
jgi:prepilin-type N-terminal cleavage/methylation domain-containing protein